MKAKKPQKPMPGTVTKKVAKFSLVQQQIVRERQRHANAMAGFVAKRSAAAGIEDPARRTMALADLPHREREERERHRAKVVDLERRARETWR